MKYIKLQYHCSETMDVDGLGISPHFCYGPLSSTEGWIVDRANGASYPRPPFDISLGMEGVISWFRHSYMIVGCYWDDWYQQIYYLRALTIPE